MSTTKTFFYMILMTALFVLVGGAIDQYSGRGTWTILRIFLFISVAMNIFTFWFADRIILKMHGAQVISAEEAPQLHRLMEGLAEAAGIPKPKLCYVPAHVPNAFATGRSPSHAAVAVTQGLLDTLTEEELEGVLGHELAHIKHRDTLLQTVVASLAGLTAMLAGQTRWGLLLGGRREGEHSSRFAALGVIFVAVMAPIFAAIVSSLISKQREYAADASGASYCGRPEALASALQRIEAETRQMPFVDLGTPATEHLYFVNHFSLGKGAHELFSSHPPTEDRVRRLMRMAVTGKYEE